MTRQLVAIFVNSRYKFYCFYFYYSFYYLFYYLFSFSALICSAPTSWPIVAMLPDQYIYVRYIPKPTASKNTKNPKNHNKPLPGFAATGFSNIEGKNTLLLILQIYYMRQIIINMINYILLCCYFIVCRGRPLRRSLRKNRCAFLY